jgi:hypothetical protein
VGRGTSDLKRALTFGGQAPLSVGALIAGMAVATVGGTLWAPLARLLTLEVPTLETPSWVVLLEAWRLLTWPFFQGQLPGSLLTLLFAGFMLLWLGRQLSYAWSEQRFLVRFAVLSAGSGLGTLLLLTPFGYPAGYFGIWAVLNALLLTWGLIFPNQRISWFGRLGARGGAAGARGGGAAARLPAAPAGHRPGLAARGGRAAPGLVPAEGPVAPAHAGAAAPEVQGHLHRPTAAQDVDELAPGGAPVPPQLMATAFTADW